MKNQTITPAAVGASPTFPLSARQLEQFVKTDETGKTLMETVFFSETNAKVVREIMEPLQNEIVDFYKFQPVDERGKDTPGWYDGEKLTFEGLFLASEDDFNLYLREIEVKQAAAGLRPSKPGNCPLLEAESLQRESERFAVEYFAPLFGIDAENLLYSFANYKKFVDLLKTIYAPLMDTKKILSNFNI